MGLAPADKAEEHWERGASVWLVPRNAKGRAYLLKSKFRPRERLPGLAAYNLSLPD